MTDRSKEIAEEKKQAKYETKMTTNIRPYLVSEGNLEKLAKVGGIDRDKLRADLAAFTKAGKPLILHLDPMDVRAAGGLE